MSKIVYTKNGTAILKLPSTLSFKNKNIVDFDSYLSIFDWDFAGSRLIIDGKNCINANYQALALLIQYIWYLKTKGCYVKVFFNIDLVEQVHTMSYTTVMRTFVSFMISQCLQLETNQ